MNRFQGPSRRPALVAATLLVAAVEVRSASAAEIFVTTTVPKISTSGGCSLQEAIFSANFNRNLAIDSTNPDHFITTECVAGDGDDTIVLGAGLVYPMSSVVDDASNDTGPTATPIIFSNIVVEGHGARLEHVPNGVLFRAFAVGTASVDLGPAGVVEVVSGTGNLTLRNVHIQGFAVKGGDGATGGGGGLGAGGGVFVRRGGLTVENCTFEANGAAGGNGSWHSVLHRPGGGGGGLAGNGGFANGDSLELGDGGGGGGGGSRGNGGNAGVPGQPAASFNSGGGGGGTVGPGAPPAEAGGGGFACGGDAGSLDEDGDAAGCDGGGGGGGGQPTALFPGVILGGDGGHGRYGGGGGGAGYNSEPSGDIGRSGGNGGFGGGGGSGSLDKSGGDGGFGGGGGRGASNLFDAPGEGGSFAGSASIDAGGGGAGLGGAIFNHGGNVLVLNSTFTGNFAVRGLGGHGGPDVTPGAPGTDAGGAILSVAGSLTVLNSTLSGNESTGEGAGIVVYRPTSGEDTSFTLRNTIIANSLPAVRECFFRNAVVAEGSGNLIEANFGCPGMSQSGDPQLGPLQLNAPGDTPTMEIAATSPAVDNADPASALPTDQRGVARPFGAGPDIGAYERGNTPPVAVCQDVTVTAGEGCTADASVDNGSYDPDAGDSITLVQSPAGPYPLGDTSVTLTVEDSMGASASCTGTVTVVDDTPPVVTGAVSQPALAPARHHDLANVGLTASASDACGDPTSFAVQVFGDEDDETPAGDAVFSPDAAEIAVDTLRLRAERVETADGRVYLNVVTAVDSSGNSGFTCNTVIVPRNASAASIAAVQAQAAAALSYCQTHIGAAPPGYFVIGNGPVVGNKQ